MRRLVFIVILSVLTVTYTLAQQAITVVQYEGLQKRIRQYENATVLVNFWATWCAPCMEEMPRLMAMNEKYKGQPGFKLLLVSLDSKKILEKLPAFLVKNNIKAEVLLLDDNKRMNEWIPAIEPKWQGNLPATLVYHKGEKVVFQDGELSIEQLNSIAEKYLTPSK